MNNDKAITSNTKNTGADSSNTINAMVVRILSIVASSNSGSISLIITIGKKVWSVSSKKHFRSGNQKHRQSQRLKQYYLC